MSKLILTGLFIVGFCLPALHAQTPQCSKSQDSCPVTWITDGLVASDGSVWIVGERSGVFRGWVENDGKQNWLKADYYQGYPQSTSNFYCVAEDKQGRIWVGSDDQGVFVFNGVSWKQYDRENALPGERVFDIEVSSTTGQVAIATSAGLVLYSPQDESWKTLNRADGLVSDQIEAVSYAHDGTLWIAYACGGIAQIDKTGRLKEGSLVQAPWYWDKEQKVRQPLEGSGKGLPSNLCNDILCGPGRYVWLATNSGMALTSNGSAWHFLRGEDYQAKNKGLPGLSVPQRAASRRLLPEDYVTSLTWTADGLWVGFRDQGAALLKPDTLEIIKKADFPAGVKTPWVTRVLPLRNGAICALTYGNGLIPIGKTSKRTGSTPKQVRVADTEIKHPQAPEPLEWEQLRQEADEFAQTRGQESLKKEPQAIFWKEDWATKSDWCYRYGNQMGILCGANFEVGEAMFSLFEGQGNSVRFGCRASKNSKGQGVLTGLGWIHKPEDPNSLHNPMRCTKSYGVWAAPSADITVDGADLWLVIQVEESIPYELALYFYNNEAVLQADMARRDLLVELRSFKSSLPPETTFSMYQAKNQDGSLNWSPIHELDQILQEPVLARTRVVETAACGVYKTFRLNGPATYYVRIAKNYSQSARLNGIFISRLPDSRLLAPPPYDEKQFFRGIFCEYQNILLHPVPENLQITKSEQETVHAWDRVNQISWNPAELSRAHRWSMNAYRTLAHVSSQSTLIPAVRWNLKLWNQQERKQFEDTMLQCWFKNQEYFQGAYLSQEFFLGSPRVLPLKANDIELMKWMGLDWHKYFDGITPIEEEIQKLQERLEEVSPADRTRLQAEYGRKQEEKIRKAHEAMKSNQ